jgi:acetyl-CoA C-acetyltransferase
MDLFALRSHEKAIAAQDYGIVDREIAPVTTPNGIVVDRDDGPRRDTSLSALSALPPIFQEDGRVTAGNSCPLNDGAAAALVMDESTARAMGLKPLVRILSTSVSGVDPAFMGMGPVDPIKTVLARNALTIDDVDILEINEAFAAQVIPVCQEVGIDPFDDRVNPLGGALAIGHPFGMTGLRIMSSLINGLTARNGSIGVESMCVGGGQGQAMLVERC